jgi:predicted site-specific integrase-resolvase
MVIHLETHIPLSEAAKKYSISIEALTRLVRDGIIKSATTEKGDSVITVSTVAAAASAVLAEIRPQEYKQLRGKKIRVTEAARKYGVDQPNISNWARYGYIRVLDRGFQRLELDTADVKYAADVFKRAKELTGSSIKAGWVLKQVFAKTPQG